MKTIFCLMGRQGSGKTTIARNHPYYVLPGKKCREKFGAGMMANTSNPAAPEETEKFVREVITNAIDNMPNNESLYIDGFPRSVGQAEWLSGLSRDLKLHVHVQLVTCDDEVRRARLNERDQSSPDAQKLVRAREESECVGLFNVLVELYRFGFTFSIFDNTQVSKFHHKHDPHLGVSGRTNFRTVLGLHKELLDIGGCKFPPDMFDQKDIVAGTIRAKAILDMFKHIKKECDEAMELIPDKSWPILELKTSLAKLRVEWADMFHFVLSAGIALGMDADQMCEVYYRKRDINVRRQTEGYIKTKSTEDDELIGKV